jgi:hypothetical protein
MFSRSLLCFSMLLIFCMVVCSSTNTSLLSFFLTYNLALNFCSFSKAPCKFWTNLSFSFIIYLFFIFGSKKLSRILVICTLCSIAYWNIVAAFMCSSKSTSSPCINFGVWNLGARPLELVHEEPRLLCVVQISPNIFVIVAKLVLKVAYLH